MKTGPGDAASILFAGGREGRGACATLAFPGFRLVDGAEVLQVQRPVAPAPRVDFQAGIATSSTANF